MTDDIGDVHQPERPEVSSRRLSRRTMITGTAGATAAMWAAPAVTTLSRAFANQGSAPVCAPGEFVCGTTCCAGPTCSGPHLIKQSCRKGGTCETVVVDCAPFACNPGTNSCYTSCQNDTQCATGDPLYVCVSGTCVQGCPNGLTLCFGEECVDLTIDPNNCGSCGNACGSGETCSDGLCVPAT